MRMYTLENLLVVLLEKGVSNTELSAYMIPLWIIILMLLPLMKSFLSYCLIFSFKLPKNIKAKGYRKRNNKKSNYCNLFTDGALGSSFKKKRALERVCTSQIELEVGSVGF